MGIGPRFSGCSDTSHNRGGCGSSTLTKYVNVDRASGNPNPARFNINKMLEVGSYLIAEVYYPNCQNYEGKKILVFEGVPEKVLQKQISLDPHFCDSSEHPSPVARFEPTARGWNYAVSFCRSI